MSAQRISCELVTLKSIRAAILYVSEKQQSVICSFTNLFSAASRTCSQLLHAPVPSCFTHLFPAVPSFSGQRRTDNNRRIVVVVTSRAPSSYTCKQVFCRALSRSRFCRGTSCRRQPPVSDPTSYCNLKHRSNVCIAQH